MGEPWKHAGWKEPVRKDHLVYNLFIWYVQRKQIHRDRKYLSDCVGLAWIIGSGEEWGVTAHEYGVSFWGHEMP